MENSPIVDLINQSKSLILEVRQEPYDVTVVACKVDMYIVLRIHKLDNNISTLTEYEPVLLRCVNVDGSIHIFQTKCLEKKIPFLVIQFPIQETTSRKRKQNRQLVCLETPLIVNDFRKRLHGESLTGSGAIVDLSEGGCSIETKLKCELNQELSFFLDVGTRKKPHILELNGIIRNIKDMAPGVFNLGIEFRTLDIKTKALIRDFWGARSGPA